MIHDAKEKGSTEAAKDEMVIKDKHTWVAEADTEADKSYLISSALVLAKRTTRTIYILILTISLLIPALCWLTNMLLMARSPSIST